MTIIARTFFGLMAVCGIATAHASAYQASKVTMCTGKDQLSMSLIGYASGGYQIWACKNNVTDTSSATWKIDDGTAFSSATASFEPNKKYELSTEDYQDYTRTLPADTLMYHFLRVTGNETADFFTWDMVNAPSSKVVKDFYISGTVAANVEDQWYGDNYESYIHSLRITVTGMPETTFDHATLELSYDGGNTWTTYTSSLTIMSSVLPIMLPIDKQTVRYRITAYPKDCYKAVWDKAKWTRVTDDYDIYYTSRVAYEASKVTMTTKGKFYGSTTVSYTQLGTTQGGCQIWSCPNNTNNDNNYNNARFNIDDNDCVSLVYNTYDKNTCFTLSSADVSIWDSFKNIPTDASIYHFLKVKGKRDADYFNWDGTESLHPYSFYLCPKFEFKPTTDITLDKTEQCLTQGVEYFLSNINGLVLDSLVLRTSYDQGKTWTQAGGLTSGITEEIKTFSNAETVNVPSKGHTVRYQLMACPKSCYKILADGGCWTYETEDYPISLPDLNFSCSTDNIDLTTFNEDTRTYNANVSWDILSNLSDLVSSVNIQCSTDNGKTWSTIETAASAKGTTTLKVPAGYAKYQFRAEPCLKDKFADIAILNQYAASETIAPVYTPEVSLAVTGNAAFEEEGNTFQTIKLSYALNEGLWQTHGNAAIYYSYDDGENWLKLKDFTPAKEGEQTVTVDSAEGQCKLRIRVKSDVQGGITYCTAETDNISFK